VSDMELFDPVAFFESKIRGLEQELVEKRTQATILEANRNNLMRTLQTLSGLDPEQQKALQLEINALNEARHTTQRNLETVETEISMLLGKLAALRAAQTLVAEQTEEGRPA
jgi:hypothetical protein